MTSYVFPPSNLPTLPIVGATDVFPVARVFCVGRNYAAHAAEMGNEVDREAPFYFTKSAFAVARSGSDWRYPQKTNDLHHEVELVLALGEEGALFGYAAGLDMTRRDLQAASKEKRRPWDTGKDFEGSAVIGAITPVAEAPTPEEMSIRLTVNGAERQSAPVSDMVWSVPELLADLAGLYHLRAGDLIMTGTPAGVGAVVPGDVLRGEIDGLAPVDLHILPQQ